MKKFALNFVNERLLIILISIGFTLWGAGFIHKSSFITLDGRRSFSLFDDAMISMRYAWNFSHGNGLVWNPGEYVQGYTNLLMTLLMSLATLVFSKTVAVLFIQISGIVFMLLVAFLTMKIAEHVIRSPDKGSRAFVRILSFLCGLTYYPLAYWSLTGMETGLLTVLILSGIWTCFKHIQFQDQKMLLLSAVFFGLAFLTRNESIIIVPLVWGYILWETIETGAHRKHLKWLGASVGLYLGIAAGQLLFQYLYYGDYFPNTYTLRLTGMALFDRLQNGIGFITLFLRETALIIALAVLGTSIDFKKNKMVLMLCIVTLIGYQVYVGGDAWNYWRMLAPIIPLAMILNIEALFVGFNWLLNRFLPEKIPARLNRPGSLVAVLVTILILPGILLVNARFLKEVFFRDKPFQSRSNHVNVNIAIALNDLLREDATIGVFWAGSIPYYTDRKSIDFLGKSDRYIARLPPDMSGDIASMGMTSLPGHNKYDLNYSIVFLQPTYVQGFTWGGQDVSSWAAHKYVEVLYKGNTLYLLKDSPSVFWSKLEDLQ